MLDLVKLDIPPGIKRGGTELESKGRWLDSSMVRWDNGMPEPIGGWRVYSPTTEGPELLPSGDFVGEPSAPAGWNADSGWVFNPAVGGGGFLCSISSVAADSDVYFDLSGSLVEGQRYRVAVDYSGTSGSDGASFAILLNGQESNVFTIYQSTGAYQFEFVLNSQSTRTGLRFKSQGSASGFFALNAISVKALTDQDLDSFEFGSSRGSFAWNSNSGAPYLAFGTYNSLRVMNGNRVITDVTPSAFTIGNPRATERLGYGTKAYGRSGYGVPRDRDYTVSPATNWTLDSWGENLIGVSDAAGSIYELSLSGFLADDTLNAEAVLNAPTCKSLIVTAERFVFALGADGNGRQIRWSDRENNTEWTPATTNEAGDIELQTNGEIVCAENVRGRTLILTTQDAFVATYQGPPLVYGFQKVGGACGIVGSYLSCAVGPVAYWMGDYDF